MDTDQQVRERFLEESGEYFEQMEQVLLGLPMAENVPQQIDIAMRAAHSLKGGAGMMGFTPMAQVAHRLEDFLKIVRARKIQVDTGLETLLLQGVDCLKNVRQQLSTGQTVDQAWLSSHVDPVVGQLQERLGDLSEADEDQLLSEEEDVDIAVLVFNGGVEEALDAFEADQNNYSGEELRQALCDQANRLGELGLMGGIDAFVSLCESVQDQAQGVSVEQLPFLTQQALTFWRRSQSLVQLGRIGKLPVTLNFVPNAEVATAIASMPVSQVFEPISRTKPEVAVAVTPEAEVEMEPVGVATDFDLGLNIDELEALQAEMSQAASQALDVMPDLVAELDRLPEPMSDPSAETTEALADTTIAAADPDRETDEVDLAALDQLQAAFDQIALPVIEIPDTTASARVSETAGSIHEPELGAAELERVTSPQRLTADRTLLRSKTVGAPTRTGTLRIDAQALQQINDLFGTLILERNAINLRQSQLDDFASLLQERMQDLEAFNIRLRQWYDRSSMESLLPSEAVAVGKPIAMATARSSDTVISGLTQDFDALEMDQYSELHLMAREQMETVVKLQEVTADIRLGLREMGQVTQSLNGTTRQLQNRITRTQMRPFADIVSRFPRVIRDLSVQYDKPVNLKIEGEMTLFERVALDLLADPLTHILRNSFDHGIETKEDRLAAGKPAEGNINLRASQLGNRARIVIRDDGRGIDLEKIRARVRKHNISEALVAKMSEQELLSLIFDAGFSTAEKVTELSGRGVGMDVVRTNLNQVGGDIQVETNLGQGTTFTIDIPLSLSVLRVMLLEQQNLVFAVPVDSAEELISVSTEAIRASETGPQVLWQEQHIPLIALEQHLIFNSSAASAPLEGKPMIDHQMALVVRQGDRYYAVSIQRYWGEQEVATRPITSPIPMPTGFVGATVLGDGRVIPLVDLPQLAANVTARELDVLSERDGLLVPTQPTSMAPVQPSQNTVLVVDDSVHLRRYLTLTLEKAGYFVEQARDGQEAVDKLLGGLQVQAVLCDVEMPRLDGYGVLDEIKTRPEFESLPISMLTSRSSEKHRKLAMNLGASAYFSKPYNDQELLTTLEALIGASRN